MTDIGFEGFDRRRQALPMVRNEAVMLRPEFVYEPESSSDLLDLRKIWSAVWRHRLLVMAIVAVTLALGVLALFLVHPTFRASASVEIEDQAVKVLGTEDRPVSSGNQDTDRLLQTQIDILKSRALAERVADGLNLAGNNKFLEAQGVKPKDAIRREQVIQALRDNLVVSLPRNSRVVPVEFDSASPALAGDHRQQLRRQSHRRQSAAPLRHVELFEGLPPEPADDHQGAAGAVGEGASRLCALRRNRRPQRRRRRPGRRDQRRSALADQREPDRAQPVARRGSCDPHPGAGPLADGVVDAADEPARCARKSRHPAARRRRRRS